MTQGLTDSAVATSTGLSIGTVRRHITAFTAELQATSRFAAGAAAHRRGWIE